MNTENVATQIETALAKDFPGTVKPLKFEPANRAIGEKVTGEKAPTLTQMVDQVIEACQTRIKWLEAIRSTL